MSTTDDIRNAVHGADRAFPVIEGGKGKDKPPPPKSNGPDRCPVTSLGHFDGRFYFLDAIGQRRDLAARALGNKQEIVTLFGGKEDWLRAKFPKYAPQKPTKDDEQPSKPDVIDFLVNATGRFLINACFVAGMYGDHLVLRRPGVWPDADGGPVVHCGDQVMLAGEWVNAGDRTRRKDGKVLVWAAAAPTPRPDAPCEGGIGRQLQQDIQALFNFRHKGGAIMALGVLGVSYFGAAARWRPSMFLTGPAGCGKTSLLQVIRACSPMHSFSNDTSKAGLAGAINGRAMLCLIDENEKSDDLPGRAAKSLFDLVLTASGGDGTEGLRANADGSIRHIAMVGSFVMSATAVPEMRETHMGRIAVLDMQPPENGEDFRTQHEALIEKMAAWGPALWARALGAWQRYNAALGIYRVALKDGGCQPREMDQYGAILAGWWILTEEGTPDARNAQRGVAALDGFIRTADIVDEGSNARRLLQYLLTFAIQMDRSTARETIASLIDAVIHTGEFSMGDDSRIGANVATRALQTHGIRVIRATDKNDARGRAVPRLGPHGIWINTQATELRRLFDNSDWAGGRWITGLLEVKSARRSPTPLKVGASACRAIWISLDELGMEAPDFEPEN
jgi:hypothetical protein